MKVGIWNFLDRLDGDNQGCQNGSGLLEWQCFLGKVLDIRKYHTENIKKITNKSRSLCALCVLCVSQSRLMSITLALTEADPKIHMALKNGIVFPTKEALIHPFQNNKKSQTLQNKDLAFPITQ